MTEPDTYNLLLGEFTKARRLFPKYGSREVQRCPQRSGCCSLTSMYLHRGRKAWICAVRIDELPLLTKTHSRVYVLTLHLKTQSLARPSGSIQLQLLMWGQRSRMWVKESPHITWPRLSSYLITPRLRLVPRY